ncbi:hypothetical protein RKE25_02460 [Dyella sp. BiH032]|uniref:hypothetical protein n=1 Tax=Dyella sp. BiH032 TaxID=3075430 RepID=UPI002892E508|nr:hypothetical protein [Dyella sp. BiH032]WNL46518.1 hypothetical protein RKE25_02460 [Dyella sp. BiH032]
MANISTGQWATEGLGIMTLKVDESHVASPRRESHHAAGRLHACSAEPLQIVEHLIGRTEYLSGVAVSLSRAAAAGDLTEGEVFQQLDLAAVEFRRHLDALLELLTHQGAVVAGG